MRTIVIVISLIILSSFVVDEARANDVKEARTRQGKGPLSLSDPYVGSLLATKSQVSDTGAFSFVANIQEPPGKMTPGMGISCSSDRASSNLLGLSCTLKGTVHISRCARNLAQDNETRAVSYTSQDRYCIGGERLVAVDNTTYGTDASVYTNEITDFTRFVAHGEGADGSPLSFVAFTKSGHKMTFGLTSKSRVRMANQTTVIAWLLDSKIDAFFNCANYSYAVDEKHSSFQLTAVTYGGNLRAGTENVASVEFTYESRPDVTVSYVRGSKVSHSVRLKSIETYSSDDPVLVYTLNYDQECWSGHSRLVSIDTCDAKGTTCTNPTTIGWTESSCPRKPSVLPKETIVPGATTTISQSGLSLAELDMSRVRNGHYDSNGLSDLYYVTSGNESDLIYLNQGGGQFVTVPGPVTCVSTMTISQTQIDLRRVINMDVDGDDVADVIVLGVDGPMEVWLNDGEGGWPSTPIVTGPNLINLPSEQFFLQESLAQRAEGRIRWGDLDGDGLTDIFRINGYGTNSDTAVPMEIFRNTGGGHFAVNATAYGPAFPIGSGDDRAALDLSRILVRKLDADKLSDILYFSGWGGTPVPASAYMNKGLGDFFATTRPEPFGPALSIADRMSDAQEAIARFQIVDHNADGLKDFAIIKGHGEKVPGEMHINHGNGTFAMVPTPAVGIRADDPQLDFMRVRHIDVNGDGRPEYFVIQTDAPAKVYFNNGSGYDTVVDGPVVPLRSGTETLDFSALRFDDFDGDGSVDVYRIKLGNGTDDVILNSVAQKSFMCNITTAFRSTTRVSFGRLSNPALYSASSKVSARFPVVNVFSGRTRLVSVLEKTNGVGGWQKTTYRYRGMQKHAQGLGLLGMLSIRSTDGNTNFASEHTYSHDWTRRLQHRVSSSKVLTNESVVQHEEQYSLSSQVVRASSRPGSGAYYIISAPNTRIVKRDLNGEVLASEEKNTTSDMYGNVIETSTSLVGPDGVAHLETRRAYYDNIVDMFPTTWRLGLLRERNVTREAVGEYPAVTRRDAFEYHNMTWSLAREIVEPGNVKLSTTSDIDYDLFGNKISVSVSGANIPTQVSSWEFDDRGRFRTSATNSLGHTIRSEHEHFFGTVVSLQDVNNVTTRRNVDQLGRVFEVEHADGSTTKTEVFWCENLGEIEQCSETSVFYVQTTTRCKVVLRTFYDILGRVVRSTKPTTDSSTQNIVQDVVYDERGLLARRSEPYFDGESVLWTRYKYDVLRRVIETTMPSNVRITNGYRGLHVESRYWNTSYVAQRTSDVRGKLVRSENGVPGEDKSEHSVTIFRYDSWGHRVQIIDDAGNTVNASFDNRGRRTSVSDGNLGIVTFEYDQLGQMLSATDGSGRRVVETRDVLGRLVNKTFNEGSITWNWDAPGAIGKLHSVSMPSSFLRQTFEYDPTTTRQVSMTLTYSPPQETGEHFQTFTSYDFCGRHVSSKDPAGFVVESTFDPTSGRLMSVSSPSFPSSADRALWTANEFDARGHVLRMTLGSSEIRRTFDPATGRLTHLDTTSKDEKLQSLSVAYDELGEVTNRTNELFALVERFRYDRLGRLTKASVGDDVTIQHFQYDSLGNVKEKTDVGIYVYGEGSAGPHAVSSIHDNSGSKRFAFSYDASGRLKTDGKREFEYNGFGQLARVSSGNLSSVTYVYGPNGKEFKRVEAKNATTSVTTITVGSFQKVYHRSQNNVSVICRRAVGSSVVVLDNCEGSSFDVEYIARDHLGSVDVVFDDQGTVLSRQSFDAFGSRRDPNTWVSSTDSSTWDECAATERGFTNQVELYRVGLVIVGGARAYDPMLGRVFAADPTIQRPGDGQDLNRYSLDRNNPLSHVDRSGFGFFDWIGHLFKSIFSTIMNVLNIVVDVFTGHFKQAIIDSAKFALDLYLQSTGVGGFALDAVDEVFDAIATKLEGGSWSDVFRGMLRDEVSMVVEPDIWHIVGGALPDNGQGIRLLERSIMHGVVGGALTSVEGGKFSTGFATDFASELVSPAYRGNDQQRLMEAGIVGGAASVLSGGSFMMGYGEARSAYKNNDEFDAHKKDDENYRKAKEALEAHEEMENWGKFAKVFAPEIMGVQFAGLNILRTFELGPLADGLSAVAGFEEGWKFGSTEKGRELAEKEAEGGYVLYRTGKEALNGLNRQLPSNFASYSLNQAQQAQGWAELRQACQSSQGFPGC